MFEQYPPDNDFLLGNYEKWLLPADFILRASEWRLTYLNVMS